MKSRKNSLVSQFRQAAEIARSLHIVYVKNYLSTSIPIPGEANVMPIVILDVNTSRSGDVNLNTTSIYVTESFVVKPKENLVIGVRSVSL